jgi:hypothetical protein
VRGGRKAISMIPEESNLSEYSRDHNRFPFCQSELQGLGLNFVVEQTA